VWQWASVRPLRGAEGDVFQHDADHEVGAGAVVSGKCLREMRGERCPTVPDELGVDLLRRCGGVRRVEIVVTHRLLAEGDRRLG
jgi:hypothetical protein